MGGGPTDFSSDDDSSQASTLSLDGNGALLDEDEGYETAADDAQASEDAEMDAEARYEAVADDEQQLDAEMKAEAEYARDYCRAIMASHLEDYRRQRPDGTFASWIADLHPENVTVDRRLEQPDSEWRLLWDESERERTAAAAATATPAAAAAAPPPLPARRREERAHRAGHALEAVLAGSLFLACKLSSAGIRPTAAALERAAQGAASVAAATRPSSVVNASAAGSSLICMAATVTEGSLRVGESLVSHLAEPTIRHSAAAIASVPSLCMGDRDRAARSYRSIAELSPSHHPAVAGLAF